MPFAKLGTRSCRASTFLCRGVQRTDGGGLKCAQRRARHPLSRQAVRRLRLAPPWAVRVGAWRFSKAAGGGGPHGCTRASPLVVFGLSPFTAMTDISSNNLLIREESDGCRLLLADPSTSHRAADLADPNRCGPRSCITFHSADSAPFSALDRGSVRHMPQPCKHLANLALGMVRWHRLNAGTSTSSPPGCGAPPPPASSGGTPRQTTTL